MKKFLMVATMILSLFMIPQPTQTEAADHYLCTTSGDTTWWLDDTYLVREGTQWMKVRIFMRQPDNARTVYCSIGYEVPGKWLYDINGNAYAVTYNNYSAYARDWLINNGYMK